MEMKERIVEHTTKMFVRDGVKSVRMDDIASEMGISKRTIYEIFGDKENLIVECLGYFHCKMKDTNEEMTKDANNIIEEYLMIMDLWDKRIDATYNIMNDVKKFYPKIYERHTVEHARVATLAIKEKLEKGVEQGYLLKTLNIDLAMTVIGYSIYGVIKSEMLTTGDITEREAFKFILTYFIRGIASLKGIKLIDDYFDKKYNNG